jgi:hypothetical protein
MTMNRIAVSPLVVSVSDCVADQFAGSTHASNDIPRNRHGLSSPLESPLGVWNGCPDADGRGNQPIDADGRLELRETAFIGLGFGGSTARIVADGREEDSDALGATS